MKALPMIAAFDIGGDELKVVAGSVLAAGVVVLIFVLREKNVRLRGVFGVLAFGLLAFGFYLFVGANVKTAPQLAACRETLAEVRVLAATKLIAVQTEQEAKSLGQKMIERIDASKCPVPAAP